MALQLAREAQREADSQLSGNHMISPSIGDRPDDVLPSARQSNHTPTEEQSEADVAMPKPRRMRKRFVCRNGTWLRTKRLKHFRTGEPVFVRNGPREFVQIGVVNKKGGLPACYLED